MTSSGENLLPETRLEDIAVAPGDSRTKAEREEDALRVRQQIDDANSRSDPDTKDAPANARNLDAGVEDSMDASDPPSSTQP